MKIAYIMKSEGLEYDDRIRKEMFSIRSVIQDVEFKIFAFCGKDNRTEEGYLSYGVPYEFVSVRHRDGSRKDVISMLRKEYDFYKQISPRVKDFDMLWVCDAQPFFFPLFSRKPVIWDLHEIPASIIGSRIKNLLFHRMERRCRWLIHANQERINYLKQTCVILDPEKNLALRNYPDKDWMEGANIESDVFLNFKEWLSGEEYIYLQGVNCDARYPFETLSAIMEAHVIKTVVIGTVPAEVKDRISKIYSDADRFIYYTGQLVQSDTASFISHCKFSLVFYTTKTPNNRYCEPNRMFQCLAYGKPVIVGCNESMASIIKSNGNGIVLNSDGGNVKDIVAGIMEMELDYNIYKTKADHCKNIFEWGSQKHVFEKILNKEKEGL